MSFTPEQKRAVEARGEVLVSASAGAGKTTVMIKRLPTYWRTAQALTACLP